MEEDKPADWHDLFSGNNDDRFRLGLSVTKKSVRLYSPFTSSDVLICSPIGLRQITGAEGDKKREFDFLSSIEVCIVDRADVLRMQNWEHVVEVLQLVNRKPQDLQNIDISRLRPAFADDKQRGFRQTIVTAAGQSLDAEGILTLSSNSTSAPKPGSLAFKLGTKGRKKRTARSSGLTDDEDEGDGGVDTNVKDTPLQSCLQNKRGTVRLADPPEGIPLQRSMACGIARQFFLHVDCPSIARQSECLLDAFINRYWHPLGHSLERLIILAPSYYNFLKIREFLRSEGASFSCVYEYAKNQELSRSRFKFFHGERRVLLATERFLWYRRYRLKGADYVLFFWTSRDIRDLRGTPEQRSHSVSLQFDVPLHPARWVCAGADCWSGKSLPHAVISTGQSVRVQLIRAKSHA